ncbi:MAG: hypothetical protein K2M91_15940 [Lachnospiraceae bacterium]|nr:hypothetical protein [Lachnospiraceae bacterium]
MNIQRQKKGEFGYPPYERNRVIIRTAAYFLISLAVFLLGYFSTGKKENLLTIVAVLGMLPSSKSLVSVIMYFKIPKFSETVYREIAEKKGSVSVIYSMYLTSYKLNYPINCFAVRGNNLIGYTEFPNCDAAACEEHIQGILKQNSIKSITIKIFHEKSRFMERLTQLQALEPGKKEVEVLELLCDISL